MPAERQESHMAEYRSADHSVAGDEVKLSRLKRLVFGTVYLGLSTVVIFLLIELLVRLFAPQVLPNDPTGLYLPDVEIGWRRAPNKRFSLNTGERDVEFCTDRRGHRIDCETVKPHCDKRVLVLGDSFVEAKAIPWPQLVWARLEKDTGACFDVAGVGAYGIAQYAQSLQEHMQPGWPRYDLVIVNLYDGNDFSEPIDSIPPPRAVQNKPFRLLPASLDENGLRNWAYPYNQVVEKYSHFYILLRHTIRMMRLRADTDIWGLPGSLRRSVMTDELLDTAAGGIESIATMARARGWPVLLINIPYRASVTDPGGTRLREGFPEAADDIDTNTVVERFLPRLLEIDGLYVVDLLRPMRARQVKWSWWGSRDTHLSPEGHAVWYQIVRPEVRLLLGLPTT